MGVPPRIYYCTEMCKMPEPRQYLHDHRQQETVLLKKLLMRKLRTHQEEAAHPGFSKALLENYCTLPIASLEPLSSNHHQQDSVLQNSK